MYVSWGTESVNYSIGIIGDCSVSQLIGTEHLYEIRGSLTSISHVTLDTINNCVMGSIYNRRSSTPQIRYRSLIERFTSYVQRGTLNDGWYGGTMYLKRRYQDDTITLETTSLDYVSDGNTYKNECNILLTTRLELFVLKSILTSPTTIDVYLGQYKPRAEEVVTTKIFEDIEYNDGDLSFSFINYDYDLYDFTFQHNNLMYITRAVISEYYNGTSYLDDNSFIARRMLLTDYNQIPIFARQLYNKTLIENTINSTAHVPRNMLNDDIISAQQLISDTNSVIDNNVNELTKNKYEELYINFIDTYRVIDNNNKNTYQSSATAKVVREINEGFTDYRITNYRINYNDGTHKDRMIEHYSLSGRVATITFNVLCDNAKNIEFYDENYTTPFATIDLSNYSGAYKVEQKVKIE